MERPRDQRRHSAEYSGRTVEEALENASRDLGVPVQELEYETLHDSTRSFLGLVRTGEVVVRVTWEPRAEKDSAAPADVEANAPSPADKIAPEPSVEERVPEPTEMPAAETTEADVTESRAEPEDEEEVVDEEIDEELLERNPPELEPVALDVLTTLLDKIGVLAAVEVVDKGGQIDKESEEVSPVILNVVGDDLGILIGRRGETLRSLQFMTRLIVSRRLGVWPNLVIDVEGYKERREESLRALALRVADQVRESGQQMALEPMPAHERRVVHIALRHDPDVYTESTGKEDRRKVQIIPK